MNSTQIATVASGVISLIQTGQEIYRATANAMDSIEKQATLAGKDKKKPGYLIISKMKF